MQQHQPITLRIATVRAPPSPHPQDRYTDEGKRVNAPASAFPGGPLDSLDQLVGRDPKRAGHFDQRVDTRDTGATLEQADLGAMQAGGDAELFLGEIGLPAGAAEVLTKAVGDLDGVLHRPSSRRQK